VIQQADILVYKHRKISTCVIFSKTESTHKEANSHIVYNTTRPVTFFLHISVSNKTKSKKVVIVHAIKAYRRNTDIAPFILCFGLGGGLLSTFTVMDGFHRGEKNKK
jgi:hypothetical protein